MDALVWALSTLDLAPWHFSDNTGSYNEVGYGISENIDGVYEDSYNSSRSYSNYCNTRDFSSPLSGLKFLILKWIRLKKVDGMGDTKK